MMVEPLLYQYVLTLKGGKKKFFSTVKELEKYIDDNGLGKNQIKSICHTAPCVFLEDKIHYA